MASRTTVTDDQKDNPGEVVVSESMMEKLIPYMAFRHFYRHSYSYVLKWYELEKLVIPLFEVWEELKSELIAFIDKTKSNE